MSQPRKLLNLGALAYPALRALLFRLDAERAHRLTIGGLALLQRTPFGRPSAAGADPRPIEVMGLRFTNRLGLAAGLDKAAECIDGFGALGFGFVEVGTLTPRPQSGNPCPRLFRIPRALAVINRMGFNNPGVDAALDRIRTRRFPGILGVNIGRNSDTPNERAIDDYRVGLEKVYPWADYVAVNLSSPNTTGLRDLQAVEHCRPLLHGLEETRKRLADTHGRRVPLAVKIAPDLQGAEIDALSALFLESAVDAVIATNTTIGRDGVAGLPHGTEKGGLSGAPLTARATEVIAHLHGHLRGRIPVIGSGGIMSGLDAAEKIQAGASLVQIYTGLIYRGPGLVREILSRPEIAT